MSVSILFRTTARLTLHQLARAWAGELPGAEKDPKGFEQNLVHLLLEDIVNGCLDDAGPLVEGKRLGLCIVTPGFQAGFLEGRQILDALRSGANVEFLAHRIVVMKEAALTFAQRHNLPPPTWWKDPTPVPTPPPDDMITTAASLSGITGQNTAHHALHRSRGRKPKKFERTKQAMREEILQKRLTASQLETMGEEELSQKYGVSRDTGPEGA